MQVQHKYTIKRFKLRILLQEQQEVVVMDDLENKTLNNENVVDPSSYDEYDEAVKLEEDESFASKAEEEKKAKCNQEWEAEFNAKMKRIQANWQKKNRIIDLWNLHNPYPMIIKRQKLALEEKRQKLALEENKNPPTIKDSEVEYPVLPSV